ncbi:MAG: DUF4870 domain-containing protein [Aeromicrobium sp.]|jgi:uncharacterized membrane protein|nr:DUF4870 domain-containing protein [Aeromicrobium sp.]
MSDDFNSTPPAPPAPPAPGAPAPGGDVPSDTGKLLAALGYIFGVVALIALLMEPYKNERFVKHHAVQAIGLWLAGVVFSVGATIVGIIPIIGWIIALLIGLASIGLFVLAIMGAIKAFQGEMWEMPVLYGIVKSYI